MLARFQYACVLAALGLAGALTLAQPGETNSTDALLQRGQAELAAKEWRAAEATFREAVQSERDNVAANSGLGRSLYESGQFLEAISAYKQALSLEPNNANALLQLGACYYHSHAYREAVVPLEKYVAAKPKNFTGFYYLGHSYFELRQFAQAVRPLQAAHELNPDDALTSFGLFGSYMATGQYEKACELYPFIFTAAGILVVFCYVVGLAWMLVISFKPRAILAPPVIATMPEHGCPPPPPPGDCPTAPPVLPGIIPCAAAAVGESRAPVVSKGNRASAQPGVWFSLGWLALLIAGQFPCALLLGFLLRFRGAAVALAAMGAASLPLVVAASAGFTRQPWGGPFGWPRPFPRARLLVLSLLGLVCVQLFDAGYTKLVEWITHQPFPVQLTVPLIQEALKTNPISVVFSIVFCAPLAEEVLFRGLLFGALQKWLSARWTILLTAFLFSLIHMQAIYFLPIFLVGLLCGWARHKSGSLAVPMLLHVLNNGISLLLLHFLPEAI